jgi:O-antigen ligase
VINSVILFFLFGCLIILAMSSRRHLVFGLLLTGGIPYTLFMPRATILGMGPQAIYLFIMMGVTLLALLFYFQEFLELAVRFWAITLFLLYAMLSLLWAADTAMALRMLMKLAAPFLFFCALQAILQTEEDMLLASRSAFICCFIVLVLAVFNHLTRGALYIGEASAFRLGTTTTFAAPYMSPANFSFFMGSGAVLALGYWFATARFRYLAIYLILAVAVFVAFTRISMAGLVIGTGVIIFLMARSTAIKFLFPVLIVVIFVTAFFTVDSFRNRMFKSNKVSLEQLVKTDPKHLDDLVSTTGRTSLWNKAIEKIFNKNIVLGGGAGAVDSWLQNKVKLHSEYLRLLCDLGIVGLALYLAALVQIAAGLVMSYLRADTPLQRQFAATGLGALAYYAITLATDNSLNYVTEFGLYVFAMAGGAFVGLSPESQPVKAQPDRGMPLLKEVSRV